MFEELHSYKIIRYAPEPGNVLFSKTINCPAISLLQGSRYDTEDVNIPITFDIFYELKGFEILVFHWNNFFYNCTSISHQNFYLFLGNALNIVKY